MIWYQYYDLPCSDTNDSRLLTMLSKLYLGVPCIAMHRSTMQPFQQKPSFIGHSPYEQVIPGLRSSSSVEALLQHILYTYKYIVHHNSPTSTNAEPLKPCLPWWRGTSSCGADKTQVCKWGAMQLNGKKLIRWRVRWNIQLLFNSSNLLACMI